MAVAFDVVSIGCLSHNPFWNEKQPVRAAHATTVLVRDRSEAILVDPSLPGEWLADRLGERTGLKPQDIGCVFLTNFRLAHRRGLALFDRADWLMGDDEIEAARDELERMAASARNQDASGDRVGEGDLALLRRIKPAPEKITARVHLFPSPGPTPGSCSLLLLLPAATAVVAGDVIVTRDYYEHGRVFEQCYDVRKAQECFAELAEVADQIVPGHDGLFVPLPKY
jgi:glyoxylase-like metal-dependent hydrolase (beta-lactamase superfamily II)